MKPDRRFPINGNCGIPHSGLPRTLTARFKLRRLALSALLRRMQIEPKPPEPSLVYRPLSYVERLDWAAVFPKAQPVEVELGSGDGGFMAQWAALHLERNFIGVERLLGRLRKLDKKGRRAGMTHLRVVRIEASYFLTWLLPPRSVSALHLYFPDPWPKRRHWKHRLVNAEFAEATARVLTVGGVAYFRTDNADYFAQVQSVFAAHPAFRSVETPAELASVVTDFERDFNAQGIPTLRAAYQRIAILPEAADAGKAGGLK